MKNIMLLNLFILIPLHAMDYNSLLNKAMQNNSMLKISKNITKQRYLESKISTRVANPKVAVEISDFSSELPFGDSTFGGRVEMSQSLLFPSLKVDKEVLGVHRVNLEKERYRLQKSEFKYRFSMKYLDYKESSLLHDLSIKSFKISQNIMYSAKTRYEQGAGLKSDYLKTKIAHKNLINYEKQLSLKVHKSLNILKIISNIQGDLDLDYHYKFRLNSTKYTHPLVALSQKEKLLTEAKLKVASHTMESYEVFSELENEPEQGVFRIGLRIDLPVFHNKDEEKKLLKLEQSNQVLRLENQTKSLAIEGIQLKEENSLLKDILTEHTALRNEQDTLLQIYQKGYSIAKVNLLAVEMSKQSFIDTQEKIIKTHITIEKNIIRMNYLKGEKND